jgi:hypothetical protein
MERSVKAVSMSISKHESRVPECTTALQEPPAYSCSCVLVVNQGPSLQPAVAMPGMLLEKEHGRAKLWPMGGDACGMPSVLNVDFAGIAKSGFHPVRGRKDLG